MKRRLVCMTSLIAIATIVAGGCASQSTDASRMARDGLRETTTSTPPTTTTLPCTHTNFLESVPPKSPLPPPGQMPEGTFMREIQDDHKLVAGVDENTPKLADRNTGTNQLEGLEIDLVRAIAQAITGDPDAAEFKTVVTAEKNQVVADGTVDLTASADSMTCARWNLVDFSTEYLTAHQKLLVRNDAQITGVDDLAGRTVCVTEGSSSIGVLKEQAPATTSIMEVPARNDCLVALQEGKADAYLGHDTFDRGLQAQDPTNTTILPQPLSEQNYGIAISKQHSEMVPFVNAVLEQMRQDGRLQALYDKWLGADAPSVPEPRYTS